MYIVKDPYRFEWGSIYIEDPRYEGGYTFEEGEVKKEFTSSDLTSNEKNYIDSFLKQYEFKQSKSIQQEVIYDYVWDQVQYLEYEVFQIDRNASNYEYFDKLPEEYMGYQEMLWFIFIEAQKSLDKNKLTLLAKHILDIHVDPRQTRGKSLFFTNELICFLYSIDETAMALKFITQLFKQEADKEYGIDEQELTDYQTKTLSPFYEMFMSDVLTDNDRKIDFLTNLHRIILCECGFTIAAEKVKEIISKINEQVALDINEKHSHEYERMLSGRKKESNEKKDHSWDERGSVWDEYDEDGVPYEDYDK